MDQLRGAIEAVFRSWSGPRAVAYRRREHIADDLGTAVNVQAMVFGNRDEESGTGVAFTRDPSTGERVPYGDFLVNAQGEDVVAGIRNTETLDGMGARFPDAHAELLTFLGRLESHYRDMCDTEFTVEQRRLWMLQTRVGKRTGAAALRMAVEMTAPDDLGITRDEALLRVTADHLEQVLHPQFQASSTQVLVTGLGASPGAAVGRVVPDARGLRGGRRPGRARDPRAQRDVTRGRARHAGGRGHPHRAGRAGQPRRGRRPRLGDPRGGRRGAGPDRS